MSAILTKTAVEFELKQKPIFRGEIWFADFSLLSTGNLQQGKRPFLILQSNIGNRHCPCVWGAVITSKSKTKLPTHVHLDASTYGLKFDSTILLEQPRALDKWHLLDYITKLDDEKMREVENALLISAGLEKLIKYNN